MYTSISLSLSIYIYIYIPEALRRARGSRAEQRHGGDAQLLYGDLTKMSPTIISKKP